MRVGFVRRLAVAAVLVFLLLAAPHAVAQQTAHTDALNLDPQVRLAYERFYSLDFDGSLKIWNTVAQAHPQNPMSWDYLLVGTIFRELYRQDLLDTTYYAHDSFLMNKRAVSITPGVRDQIEQYTNRVLSLTDDTLKNNPNDKNALFARSLAKGFHAVFITLVDHSYSAAAHQGYSARNDSEAALKLDPQYADAQMAVGIQQFAVASLPRILRMVVGIVGVGGNKEKGISALRESAAHGVVTSVESRTVLSLFLRHDGRYAEALQVERDLAKQFPHNFLFRLEVANLLKDEGQGYQAMPEYKAVLADAAKPGFFIEPRLQLALFGLADTQRGYNDVKDAADNYLLAAEQPNCSDWLRKRAQLNAAEMYDLLHDRGQAVRLYQMAASSEGDQTQADIARKYLKTPFTGK